MSDEVRAVYLAFTGEINADASTRFAAALSAAVNQDFNEVHLSFSSPGGLVSEGVFLYNHVRALPIKTVIYNTSTVLSIAVVVFSAAEERYCSPHSMFLIHPTVMGAEAGANWERLDSMKQIALADDQRTEGILRERTRIPDHLLQARRSRDLLLSPEDAAIHGPVHAVRDFIVPPGKQVHQI